MLARSRMVLARCTARQLRAPVVLASSASASARAAAGGVVAAAHQVKQPRRNLTAPGGHKPQHPPPPADTPLTETVRDFLDPADFLDVLKDNRMDSFFGVPDSLLKDFAAYLTDHVPADRHVITANEGAAVAMATGYHLATKKFPVVYMQNSGIGNAVNPLLSIADPAVYAIPMLLMVGWRGEPGKRDEPQHMVQGKVMTSLLADMGLKFEVLPDYLEGAEAAVEAAAYHMETRSSPYVFLVKRQCFTKYKQTTVDPDEYTLSREEALGHVVDQMGPFDVNVVTTGFASREIYELRASRKQGHKRDFLTVGAMGHATAIAAGIALAKPSRQVFCVDGDGAMMMHMGTMGTIGTRKFANLKHVLINNGAHDSVGGQPTLAFGIDTLQLATGVGYRHVARATTAAEIAAEVKRLREVEGPAFLEIRTNKGARANLGRPKEAPVVNKEEFIRFLEG